MWGALVRRLRRAFRPLYVLPELPAPREWTEDLPIYGRERNAPEFVRPSLASMNDLTVQMAQLRAELTTWQTRVQLLSDSVLDMDATLARLEAIEERRAKLRGGG